MVNNEGFCSQQVPCNKPYKWFYFSSIWALDSLTCPVPVLRSCVCMHHHTYSSKSQTVMFYHGVTEISVSAISNSYSPVAWDLHRHKSLETGLQLLYIPSDWSTAAMVRRTLPSTIVMMPSLPANKKERQRIASYPGSWGRRKSLVHTVCACA